ncbi:hypothetical protein HDU87_004887 [Geranomyces variabilis]|uniref:Protein kinase domain-containing protein n=1 Tax=Geranomyces variabilis TaxID=109894 RepID=A0AAD5THK5_9FUNG|nr:hypothetical protein HDU87_004887 [Geranomyces variabilis]
MGERCNGKLEPGAHLQAVAFANVIEKILQFFNRLNTKSFLHRFVTLHVLDEELDDLSAQLDYLVADLSLSLDMDSRGLREQDAADRKADNEALERQLASLAADQQRILLTLGVGNNFVEALEAIKKTMASEVEDSVKGKFAKAAYGALVRASGGADVDVKEWTITSYEVEVGDVFARGGFGEVCMGTWRGLTTVAVKRLPGGFETKKQKKAFVQEVEVWYKLRHPNVMLLLGACPSAVQPFMIMPFMENGTLLSYAEKNPQQILKLLNESAQGLHYLHTSNIVHGDLKAINILVDGAGIPKLADFGFSVLKAGNASIGTMRAGENMGGTIRWSAPECLEGMHPNFQSDVYAFGMVMWEVFSGGEIPFYRIQSELLVIKHVLAGGRPDRPTGEVAGLCTDNIWELILSCWTVERAHRPAMPTVAGMLARAMGRTSRPSSFAGISPVSPVKTPSQLNMPSIGETAPPYTSQLPPSIVLENTLVEEPGSAGDEKRPRTPSIDVKGSAASIPSVAEEKRALGEALQTPRSQSRDGRDQGLASDTLPTGQQDAKGAGNELHRSASLNVPAQNMRIPHSASYNEVKNVNEPRRDEQPEGQQHLAAPRTRKRSATETKQWAGDPRPGFVHSASFNDGQRTAQGPNPQFAVPGQYQGPAQHQYSHQQPFQMQHLHQQPPQQLPQQQRAYQQPPHGQHPQQFMQPQRQMPPSSDPRVAMNMPPGSGPNLSGEPRPMMPQNSGQEQPPPYARPQGAQLGDPRHEGGGRNMPSALSPQQLQQQQFQGWNSPGNSQPGGPPVRMPTPGGGAEGARRPSTQPGGLGIAPPQLVQQQPGPQVRMPTPGPVGPGSAPGGNQRPAGPGGPTDGPPQPQQQIHPQQQQGHNRQPSAANADPRTADTLGAPPQGNIRVEQPVAQQQVGIRPPGPTKSKSSMSITPTTAHAGVPPSATFPTKAGAWSVSPTATGVPSGVTKAGAPDTGAGNDRPKANSGGRKQGVPTKIADSARLEEGEEPDEESQMMTPPLDPKQDQAVAAASKQKKRSATTRRCCCCCLLIVLIIVILLVVGLIGKLENRGFLWNGK